MSDHPEMVQARLDQAASSAEAMERLKFAISLVQTGLQSLTLINGGAMVALFTFLGSANRGGVLIRPGSLWHSFLAFSLGLIATLISTLGAFYSQDRFYVAAQRIAWNAGAIMSGLDPSYEVEGVHKAGNIAMFTGMAAAVLGLAAFIAGCTFALAGVLV